MRHTTSRISEDLLFAVLLTALAGWLAAPLASYPSSVFDSSASVAVTAADHHC